MYDNSMNGLGGGYPPQPQPYQGQGFRNNNGTWNKLLSYYR